MAAKTIKTTFHLSAKLHSQLKAAAARRGTSIRQLLVEGAQIMLERLDAKAERKELQGRLAAARARLKEGSFELEYDATQVNELLYAAEPQSDYTTK